VPLRTPPPRVLERAAPPARCPCKSSLPGRAPGRWLCSVVRLLRWANGPFGGGKTYVAADLGHGLPGAWVADPELVGFGLHRLLPLEGAMTFRPRLRGGSASSRSWTPRWGHDGLVIAPQTLVCADCFQEILGTLRDRGHEVRLVALLARPETVLQRLHYRGFGKFSSRLGVDTLARDSSAVQRVES